MNVSLSTRNQWELIFSSAIYDIKRATLHNIYFIIMLSAILPYAVFELFVSKCLGGVPVN